MNRKQRRAQEKQQSQQAPQNKVSEYIHAGMKQHFSGNIDEAERFYGKALLVSPNHPDPLHFLGIIAIQRGNLDKAIELVGRSLHFFPNNSQAIATYATALSHKGEHIKAIELFEKSLAMNDKDPSTHNNYAQALIHLNRSEEAIDAYRKSIELNPKDSAVWSNLAIALQNQGKMDEAIEVFYKTLEINPRAQHVHSNLLGAMHYSEKFSNEQIFAESVRWGNMHSPISLAAKTHDNDLSPERKLRIGFVSSDLNQHPVTFAVKKVLDDINREQFETFIYCNNIKEDAYTEILKQVAGEWRYIRGKSDADAAEMIRNDKIDILIDLSGHTSDHRLTMFAHKPAPIQCTWIGYFDTTGMQQMDYLIADTYLVLPEEQKFYTEKLLLLPDRISCWDFPDHEGIPVAELPALKNKYVTFGCFNNLSKITPAVIEIWAKILQKAPATKIILKNKSLSDQKVQEEIIKSFERHGVNKERLMLEGFAARKDYFLAYSKMDIALDPFPYNGGTTTVDSLWMGVPVITLMGNRFVSRVGTSILGGAGLKDWITRSEGEYINKAVMLSENIDELQQIRKTLRDKVKVSPLFDGPRLTHHLENAFRSIWRDYVNKKSN